MESDSGIIRRGIMKLILMLVKSILAGRAITLDQMYDMYCEDLTKK